jgi:transcriptional regulator with XRE-family HTH domain
LGITTRAVTEGSRKIAEAEGNPEYHISSAWLTQVENGQSVPSIFKLFSLSAIYRIKFSELLGLFGVDLEKISKYEMDVPLPQTHLTTLAVYDEERPVSFPVRFDPGFSVDRTNLLARMVEVWGEIPLSLIQHLDLRNRLYGYIGLEDRTLDPLVRPGSFVQIDPQVRKVQGFPWRTEFDRPIFFFELRDGYACSWCEVQGGQLLLVPHALSPVKIRRYALGTEVRVVGQVTAVAMRIVDSTSPPTADASGWLKRP